MPPQRSQALGKLEYIFLITKNSEYRTLNQEQKDELREWRANLQTGKCGAVSLTLTPYVSHHLARVLSGGQLHCHVCSHKHKAIHVNALPLLHR